jgi:hypothetical protein
LALCLAKTLWHADNAIFPFYSEGIADANNLLSSVAEVNLNGMASLRRFDNININLNMKREEFATGESSITLSNSVAKSLLGFRVTNFLENVSSPALDTTDCEFSLRSHLLGALVRADLMYTIRPELNSDRFQFSLQKRVWPDATAEFDVIKYMGNGHITAFTGSLNWELDDFTLGVYSSYDSEHKFILRANLNLSFGMIPGSDRWLVSGKSMSSGGVVAGRAYLDKNLNNEFDKGEEIIDKVRFSINQDSMTAKDGVAVAASLPVDHYTTIRVDPAALENPLWLRAIDGVRFLARPGVVTRADFPIVETSEIDGVVKLVDGNGYVSPVSRVGLELVDINGNKTVKEVQFEFDGYYIFQKVLPGKYKLRVRAKDLKRLHARQESDIDLDVAVDSDVYSGRDVRLQKNNTPTKMSHLN